MVLDTRALRLRGVPVCRGKNLYDSEVGQAVATEVSFRS